MAQNLFLNITILITFITLGNLLIKEKNIKRNSLKWRLILGIVGGILGIILMIYSVRMVSGLIFDIRNIAIILVAILGGFVPSILASVIIGLFRIIYFGISNSSIFAMLISFALGIGCPMITSRTKVQIRKWVYSAIYCSILVSISYIVFVAEKILLLELILSYWGGLLVVSIVIYRYVEYLSQSNKLFKKYQEEAAKDFLTGLNNVRQFDKIYNEITCEILEREEHLSLLFIDIDFFKKVNDTYGHAEGDIVLKELGNILLKTSRRFDVVSRNGGEEFSIMLMDCHTQQAINIAERIRLNVEQNDFVLTNGKTIKITISIGVATYPNTTTDFSKLLKEADNALYKAKQTGRNKVVVADGECELCIVK